MSEADEILTALRRLESPKDRAGMARFGVNIDNALGISVKTLRQMAKDIGRDHDLALNLWQYGAHEARILASIVADPALFKQKHARIWVKDFNSWDLCDQCCQNLFWQIDGAHTLALSLTANRSEFTKRAGYAILAMLAFKSRALTDADIAAFLPVIEAGASAKLRQEGCQLVPASDRQAQFDTKSTRDRVRRSPKDPGRKKRPLDRQRRTARTHQRQSSTATARPCQPLIRCLGRRKTLQLVCRTPHIPG